MSDLRRGLTANSCRRRDNNPPASNPPIVVRDNVHASQPSVLKSRDKVVFLSYNLSIHLQG